MGFRPQLFVRYNVLTETVGAENHVSFSRQPPHVLVSSQFLLKRKTYFVFINTINFSSIIIL